MPGAIQVTTVDALSTITEVEAALQSTLSEGAEVDRKLEQLLSRASDKASERAIALSKTAQRAAAVSDDAEELTSLLDAAARTANTVSSRVRFLDSVLTRARTALTRVEDVLTLRVCAEGAKTSLSAGDLSAAAKHVARYLQLSDDVRSDESSAAAVAQISQSIDELSRKVREQADTVLNKHSATDADQTPVLNSVIAAVGLFVPVGLRQEGLDRLSSFLRAQIARETDIDIRSLLVSASAKDNAGGADEVHIMALARLFEAIAAYLHNCETSVKEIFGKDALVSLAISLQNQCDIHSDKILVRYMEARHMEEIARAVRAETANARDLDALLNELTVLSQRISGYFSFLTDRYAKLGDEKDDIDNGGKGNELQERLQASKLADWVTKLSTRYVAVEAYFMRENARKAIRIDEPGSEDAETSTAVDDFFFVIQKCMQRAMAYGDMSVEANIAVLQHVNNCLMNDLLAYVRRKLRETETALEKMLGGSSFSSSLPTAALSVTFLTEFAKANIAKAGVGDTDNVEGEDSKYDFFVAVNNATVSAEYAMRFRTNVEKTAAASTKLSAAARSRISVPLATISETSRALNLAGEHGIVRLTTVLTGIISADIDNAVASANYLVTDAANTLDDDSNTSFARELTEHIESKVLNPSLERRLTESNWDALVRHVAEWTASRVESGIFLPPKENASKAKQFNALGGLRADRDVRALSAYFAGKSRRGTVRDVFARLSQVAMLLNLERPAEIYDIWGANAGGMTWRLTPAEVRRALLLRADFKRDAVRLLKL